MPMYQWECEVCGVKCDVIRKFDEHDRAPDAADLDTACPKLETGHAWRKLIGAPAVAKGPGWGAGKGYW